MSIAIEDSLATADIDRQIRQNDGYAISLDSMWRACGCPIGRDPRRWAEVAEPYIAGVAGYLRNLDRMHGLPAAMRPDDYAADVLFTMGAADRADEHWRVGDLMGTQFVAIAYAAFLDGRDAKG